MESHTGRLSGYEGPKYPKGTTELNEEFQGNIRITLETLQLVGSTLSKFAWIFSSVTDDEYLWFQSMLFSYPGHKQVAVLFPWKIIRGREHDLERSISFYTKGGIPKPQLERLAHELRLKIVQIPDDR